MHRHMNRHGHKKHKTDLQKETDYDVELNEIDELNRINKAVDRQPPVDMTEVQKKMLGPTLVMKL